MWDTSGSTNFDSVRPLSYSEVARKKDSSQLSLKKPKNYQIAGWHLPHMLQHCRAHLPLQCPKSLGCWGEEESEKMRWIRLLKSAITVRWWTLLYTHNLTYIGFCQQVGKHSAAPLLLCGCQSDLRWEMCLNLIVEFLQFCLVSMNLYWPVLDLILKQQQDYLAPARPLSP